MEENSPENYRITPEHAENARFESKQAWSNMMDQLIPARLQQGKFFVKVGEKSPGAHEGVFGVEDNRLFVLTSPIKAAEEQPAKYVTITTDGAFLVQTSDNEENEEFIKRMNELEMGGINHGRFVPANSENPAYIYTAGYGSHERSRNFRLSPIKDMELVKRAILQSVEQAESPHKAALKEAQIMTEQAQSLSAYIQQLPPR